MAASSRRAAKLLNDCCRPIPAGHQFSIGNNLKSLTAAVSTAIQLIYVLSLLDVITSLIKLFQVESLYDFGDPKMMAGAISTIIMDLLVGAVIGFVGVFLAWLVLRNKKERPSWFLLVSTFFAWTWMIFVPIGTVIGIFMLRWRRPEAAESTAVQA